MRDESDPSFSPSAGLPVDSWSGRLLVAHPDLADPNFARTVVFLALHRPSEGTLGWVLNRPLAGVARTAAICPVAVATPLAEAPVGWGGPVPEVAVRFLAWRSSTAGAPFTAFAGLDAADTIGLLQAGEATAALALVGYAGWSAGQLEAELVAGAWLLGPPLDEAALTQPTRQLWQRLVRQLRPDLALATSAPTDPELN